MPEAWLRGPIEGVPPRLMPVAHSLTDALEEFEAAAAELDVEELWARPGEAASIGFHLRHVCGALDRLFTYARGEGLTLDQLKAASAEADAGEPPTPARALLAEVRTCIEGCIDVLRGMDEETLLDPRLVGRAGLPSNVQGLLFHAAEHTRRHAGQVIATARFVRPHTIVPEETRR